MPDAGTARIQAYHRHVLSTELAAITGSATGHTLVLAGHTTAGDGGGGVVRWDASDSSTADNGGTVWGSGTGRWKRIFSGAVNVRWFGAKGDGSTNDAAAIQAAVDYAIANFLGEVFLPAGNYSISRTIQLVKAGSVHSLVFRGECYMYATGFTGGTRITCTHSNMPAINIQGARGTVVRDMGLYGGLAAWIANGNLARYNLNVTGDTVASAWDDPSLHANAESRYAPFAAICVDGWSGSAPSPAYPTTYLAYGQSYSSDVMIDNCIIEGFNTAVVVQPCNADGNGDFVVVNRTTIVKCKWGISIGNTQSRNVDINNVKFASIFCCLTNKQHGVQNGRFAGRISNMTAGEIIKFFDFGNMSVCGPVVFSQVYAEGLWRIGDILASTSVESAVIFEGGIIEFNGQDVYRGIPSTVLASSSSNPVHVVFRGTTFGNYLSVAPFNTNGVVMDGCQFQSTSRENGVSSGSYLGPFHNATCDGMIFRLLRTDETHRIKFRQLNVTTGTVDGVAAGGNLANVITHQRMKDTRREVGVPAWASSCAAYSDDMRDRLDVPIRNWAVAKSSFASAPVLTQDATNPGYLTLVFTSLSDDDAMYYGHMPGDAIVDDQTGMVFVIRSRTGTSPSTVIAEAQNNYKLSSGLGSAYTTVDAFSDSVGNFYFLNCRIYSPKNPVIVDTTSGSSTLSNAGRDDGASYVAEDIANGDYILLSLMRDNWTADARITARDSGAQTITMDGNAVRTLARRRIPFFIRAAPSNASMR